MRCHRKSRNFAGLAWVASILALSGLVVVTGCGPSETADIDDGAEVASGLPPGAASSPPPGADAVSRPPTVSRPPAGGAPVTPDVTPSEEKPPFAPSGEVGFEVGDVAPEIVGADLNDLEFKLSDYRGRVVVLDFWGDW